MLVDKDKCIGCGNCVPYCPMGVISIENGKAEINDDECVECATCYRAVQRSSRWPRLLRLIRGTLGLLHLSYENPIGTCPTGARVLPDLEWPRSVRRAFSDPAAPHESTGVGGRGTEEIKTNDVTKRLKEGEVGFVVELGRPGTGARFRDIETVAMALVDLGVTFEPRNPVTTLMVDANTGKINPEILEEKVLSAIIEFRITIDNVPAVLREMDQVQRKIDTVCAVGISAKCNQDGSVPYETLVRQSGFELSPNGKTNLGLGRSGREAGE